MEVSPSLGLVSSLTLLLLWIKRKLRMQGIQGPPPSFLYGNLPEMQKIQMKTLKASSFQAADFIAHDYTSTKDPCKAGDGEAQAGLGQVQNLEYFHRFNLHVLNGIEAAPVCESAGAGEGDEPDGYSGFRQTLLLNQKNGTPARKWNCEVKRPFLGSAEENSRTRILHGQGQGMVRLMVESAQPLLKKWEDCIEAQGGIVADVKVDEDLRELSADVISRACFGSSYSKGKQIFSRLRSLQQTFSGQNILFGVPNFGSIKLKRITFNVETGLPARKQNKISNLERESGKDASRASSSIIARPYTSPAMNRCCCASWCLMLLALHPEWQDGIRKEQAEVFKDGQLSVDSLNHLKTVTMVIQEALRLYPPAAFVSREALEETQLGNIAVSKDPAVWGSDANEFKPERFNCGVSKACKFPQAYIPFGVGPRLCLGKNFAMVELKVVLSLIVSKFSFSLSPKYHHSPTYRMIVEPGEGVQILIQKI
uniref:Uncharacterized protein n=1 Tax=Salix viminalis TaxID=40686 RepID=A0A6N2MPI5_SALVM